MIANIPTIKEDGVLIQRVDESVNFYAMHRDELREHPQSPREQPSPQRAIQKAPEEKNQRDAGDNQTPGQDTGIFILDRI